ncbi:MAG: isoprenylcysteine carboxylmethyltransferase family protein [Myxococcales bacterium]|nr:isoprenylcysteine carboxylmethyltransferase family protein [Myxococcales bacterium]
MPSTSPQVQTKVLLRLMMTGVLQAALLLGISGDPRWMMAWLAIGLILLGILTNLGVMLFLHPDLLEERMHWKEHKNAKPWDLKIMPTIALLAPVVTLSLAALDHRYSWSPPTHILLSLAGIALMFLGQLLGAWAIAANRFFSSVVRIQTDRGHQVVDHGPYAIVRHPGYTGVVLFYLGLPLLLGAYWAYIPSALLIVLLFYRTALEDKTLQQELDGYTAYTQRVRSRLIPGIW